MLYKDSSTDPPIKLIFLHFNFWCLLPLVLVPPFVQRTDAKSLMRLIHLHFNTPSLDLFLFLQENIRKRRLSCFLL